MLTAKVSKPELCHMALGPLQLCAVWVVAIAAIRPAVVGRARLARLRWHFGNSAMWGTSAIASKSILARVLAYHNAFQQVLWSPTDLHETC